MKIFVTGGTPPEGTFEPDGHTLTDRGAKWLNAHGTDISTHALAEDADATAFEFGGDNKGASPHD